MNIFLNYFRDNLSGFVAPLQHETLIIELQLQLFKMNLWSKQLHHYYGQSAELSPPSSGPSYVLGLFSSVLQWHPHLFRIYCNRTVGQSCHLLALSVEANFSSVKIERLSISSSPSASYVEVVNVNETGTKQFSIGSISVPSDRHVQLSFHVEFRLHASEVSAFLNCRCTADSASSFLPTNAAPPKAEPLNLPPAPPLLSLSANLAQQFLREETADIWFEIGNNVIPAHKWILMARVEVFEKMFSSGMQEATTNRIPIDDTDSETFQQMLKFVYCGQFPDNLESTADALLPLTEKYNIQELKDACVSTLKTRVTKENVVQTLVLADVYRCPDLVEHCVKQLVQWKAMMEEDALEPLKEYPHLLIKMFTFKSP